MGAAGRLARAVWPRLLPRALALALALAPASSTATPAPAHAHTLSAGTRPPTAVSPADGEPVYCGRDGVNPSFTFSTGLPTVPLATDGLPDTVVQISTSLTFDATEAVVHTDHVPAILARYVRADPLPLSHSTSPAGTEPGTTSNYKPSPTEYWWRVGRPLNGSSSSFSTSPVAAPSSSAAAADSLGAVAWSEPARFTAVVPAAGETVPAGETRWGAIQAALGRAAASPVPYLLEFESGARPLVPPAAPPSPGRGTSSATPFFIAISDAVDLIIDGGGSVLTFGRYTAFLQLVNCSRVTVQNFVFDLDPLPYTALAVDTIDPGAMAVTATLLPAHPTLENLTRAMSTGAASDAKAGLYSAVGPGGAPATKRGVPEVIRYRNVTRLGSSGGGGGDDDDGAVRYAMGIEWVNGEQFSGLDGVAAGDVIVVDPRIDAGVRVWGGERVTLRQVVVRSCPNECFSSIHASSLAILGCGTELVPGRFLAANNGGHNHHGARIGQWVEAGIWENAGDDTIHVSGLVMSPLGYGPAGPAQLWLGSNEPITAAPEYKRFSFIRVGDLLQFWNPQTGAMVARRTVTAMVPPTQHQPLVLVTLDAPVGPGLVFGHANSNRSVTQVYSFNCTSNQFVFRKNRVRNGRRVGVLYKGYRSWIDSNSFEGLGGGALELWNAPVEGLWAHSVLFRNNTVTDVCQLNRAAAPVRTTVIRPRTATAVVPASHTDLRIDGNVFDTGPGSTLLLNDIAGVVVTANSITRCGRARDSSSMLNTSNVAAVKAYGNQVRGLDIPRLCAK